MDAFTLDKVEFDRVRGILADFCRCSLGKAVALRIGPSRRPETITLWLDQTTQMIEAVRSNGLPPYGGVTDITEPMSRVLTGNQATAEDFAQIASTLEGAGNVRSYLQATPDTHQRLHELATKVHAFDGEIKAIREVVGPDGEVRDDASVRLSGIRKKIATVTQRIYDVMHGYLRDPEVARLLQNVTVTLHADRFVLPVRVDNRGRLPGVVHRTSSSGATVFVEPSASVELNNELADFRDDERREVQRLLDDLSLRVAARGDQITATLRALAQIDLLAAKAQYAYQFDMVCPQLHERGPLEFHQARHPLLIDQAWRDEQAGLSPDRQHPVVPIDVRLGNDFDLLVITGSNTGGKTVTLKTVALLVLMAQSGMHIPVGRGATMPVFANVFIDVGDEQSLQQSLSTFGAHVKRLEHILAHSDRRSLVLLDELGSGTDPDEGGAIGQAVLDQLRHIGCCGMITTHLSVLKAYALNHDRVDNASVAFDIQTLRPTYHLHIGTAGESHAIEVAGRLGLPKRLTDAARKHLSSRGKQLTRALRATGAARKLAESARADAVDARLAAEVEAESFQQQLDELKRVQQEFSAWLAELTEMKPGDPVTVPGLSTTGTLVRLELHRQVAVVATGAVQVEVPLREMMPEFGQTPHRDEIASLRKEIVSQADARRTAALRAKQLQDEYAQTLTQLKKRGQQFDAWLRAIGAAKVGDTVTVDRAPGKGRLTAVDLPNLRATVELPTGPVDVPLQQLFPQSGPFGPNRRKHASSRTRDTKKPRGGSKHAKASGGERLHHRSPASRAAKAARQTILKMQPGQQVYVVPFKRPATLVRLNPEKNSAVVQSGAFEMTVALADLDLVRDQRKH